MAISQAAASDTYQRRYFSIALVIFLWMNLVGPYPFPPATTSLVQGQTSDPVRQLLYSLLLLLTIAPYAARDLFKPIRTVPVSVWLLIGWCALTVLWSPVPDIAFRRLILTAMIVLTAFLLGDALGLRRTILVTAYTLAGLVILSVVAVVIYPSGAIQQPGELDPGTVGRWRGLFEQKNVAGSIAALALVFLLFLVPRRLFDHAAIVAAALLLWYSGSRTSLAAVVAASTLTPVMLWGLKGRTLRLSVLFLITSISGVAVFGQAILEVFNDPYALTGRSSIWQALWELLLTHPIGGVGYGSIFLAGEHGALAQTSQGTWLTVVAHGHNSYLETAASTGLVGLVLLLWVVVVAPYRYIATIVGKSTDLSIVPAIVAVWVFTLLHNVLEGGFLDRDRATWIVLVLLLAACQSAAQDVTKSAASSGQIIPA